MSSLIYTQESQGRAAVRYLLDGVKLADYIRFVYADGNLAAPARELTADEVDSLTKIGSTSFQFRLAGLGYRVYGIRSDGSGRLLSYSVDSSD